MKFKIPQGWQLELWWPLPGAKEEFQRSLVNMVAAASYPENYETFIADLDSRLEKEPDANYEIWVSSGWNVYSGLKRSDVVEEGAEMSSEGSHTQLGP